MPHISGNPAIDTGFPGVPGRASPLRWCESCACSLCLEFPRRRGMCRGADGGEAGRKSAILVVGTCRAASTRTSIINIAVDVTAGRLCPRLATAIFMIAAPSQDWPLGTYSESCRRYRRIIVVSNETLPSPSFIGNPVHDISCTAPHVRPADLLLRLDSDLAEVDSPASVR